MAPTYTFSNISNADVDPDSPVDTSLMTRLRDNDEALAEWIGTSATRDVNHAHKGAATDGTAQIAYSDVTGTPTITAPGIENIGRGNDGNRTHLPSSTYNLDSSVTGVGDSNGSAWFKLRMAANLSGPADEHLVVMEGGRKRGASTWEFSFVASYATSTWANSIVPATAYWPSFLGVGSGGQGTSVSNFAWANASAVQFGITVTHNGNDTFRITFTNNHAGTTIFSHTTFCVCVYPDS